MIGFAGILLGMFTIGVMQLILATALPFIVTEIGGDALYSWVFSGYMLASLATIPLFSKLADIYGKRRFFILGMSVFAIGSLYGGFAPAMSHLLAARVVQGFGAGIITPVAMAMISDMFPAEKRGNMIGAFGFVQLLSNLLSPPLGSFITRQLNWHWIFFLTVGLVGLSVTLVARGGAYKKTSASMKPSEIDIAGALFFGGFCIFTVGFSNAISKQNDLGAPGILLLIAALSAAAMLLFIERRHKSPVIKIEFFKNKVIRSSIISSILAGAIMYGLVTVLPLCGVILNKQGFEINESNILLLFMIGITTGLLTSSRLVGKLKSGHFIKLLWVVMSVGSLLLLYAINIENLILFNVLNVIIGLCTGGVMATFLINSQNAVNSKDRTVLSGLIQLGRYFGASVGVTILTGTLPQVSIISSISQFIGAFGLLVVLCTLGFINEIL